MAEIMKYTPTAGMTADQRNEAGYYAVIKAWVQEHLATFEKWFTVAYNDTEHKITLTAAAENISHKYIALEVYNSNLYLKYPYSSSSYESATIDLGLDQPLYLYDSDDFFIGGANYKLYCGVFRGKKFDDNSDVPVFIGAGSSYIYFYYKQGSSYDNSISSAYRRKSAFTDIYIVQRLIIEASSIIMSNVYYLDSGMSLPPANDFKIGDTKYCKLGYNIVTKL